MKKALFILSGNLSTTPRAVKSILLASSNFQCDIVVINRLEKWFEQDKELIKKHNLKVTFLNLGRRPLMNWLLATAIEKTSQHLYKFFKVNLSINANASNKSSTFIWHFLKGKDYSNYSIIFGFGAGSLYPAFKLSQNWQIPFTFDVEDYHPGESIKQDAKNEQARREYLMKTLLPKAAALTSASPLIGDYTLKLIGGHPNHRVILNSFPQDEFIPPTHIPLCGTSLRFDSELITQKPELKLVWFSQKISFGRGLEQLFEALSTITHEQNLQESSHRHEPLTSNFELPTLNPEPLTSNVEPKTSNLSPIPYPLSPIPYPLKPKTYNLKLTLIGDLDPEFEKAILIKYSSLLTTHYSLLIKPPLTQPALHAELSNHDVGLALEFDSSDLNRQLCLTNKIIAYAQSGIYILATDTPAQKQFMAEDPERGLVCGQTPAAMKEALMELLNKKASIQGSGLIRFEKGRELAWEKEGEKLISLCKTIIKKTKNQL